MHGEVHKNHVQNVRFDQVLREIAQKAPLRTISKCLDDMMSTLFGVHIINHESLRGLIVPKFTMCDGTSNPFDHLMHYK